MDALVSQRRFVVKILNGTMVLEVVHTPKLQLDWLQAVVEGFIERVQLEPSDTDKQYTLDVWGNDEARLIDGMRLNVIREDGEELYGPLVVCASNPDGESVPLTMGEAMQVQLVQRGKSAPQLRITTIKE